MCTKDVYGKEEQILLFPIMNFTTSIEKSNMLAQGWLEPLDNQSIMVNHQFESVLPLLPP